jgi:hypothetical protein
MNDDRPNESILLCLGGACLVAMAFIIAWALRV